MFIERGFSKLRQVFHLQDKEMTPEKWEKLQDKLSEKMDKISRDPEVLARAEKLQRKLRGPNPDMGLYNKFGN